MQSCVDGMGDYLSFSSLVCLQEKSQLYVVLHTTCSLELLFLI